MDYLKEFCSKLQNLDRSRHTYTIFKDFLTLSTCSIANVCLFVGNKRARLRFGPLPTSRFYKSDEIEQRYLEIIKQYTKEQAEEFSKLLAFLVEALEQEYQDFLGKVFMQMSFGSSANGQFFTPYHVSKLMSEINFAETKNILKDNNFITLSEPCCGSGGIIIAFAETLKEQGYNYQHQLFVEKQ